MFGLSFIHVGFLAATVAVSVPLLIHLLMRPRARPASIGTLRFLKLALKETRRRRKIRHWLLLLLRAAAIVLLALLFARPYFSEKGGLDGDSEVVILIDRSASMSAKYSNKTLFDLAQKTAAKRIERLAEGTAVHLAYFDGLGVTPAAKNRIDSEQHPGYARTDYGLALSWAKDVLLSSTREHRKVIFLTDLQKAGLHGTTCKAFPKDVEVEVVELGNPLVGNLAVDKIDISTPTLRSQTPVVMTAYVSNYGAFAKSDVNVKLCLGSNHTSYSQKISVEGGASEPVRFSIPITQPGFYQGYFEIDVDDPLHDDNRRWIAFEARNAEKVLLVNGEPGCSVFRDETYFLEIALRLALPGQLPTLTPYELQCVPFVENKSLPDLANFRVVVLCNIPELSNTDLGRLTQFVSAGGRLLVFMGSQVTPECYASWTRSGLLGAKVTGTSDAGKFRLQHWTDEHPIFYTFSDPQRGDLRNVVFRKITKLKPVDGGQTLATTQDKEPLLIEKRLGRGNVLVFASAADCDWSAWAQSRLYVPLVHQMVGYLTGRLAENGRIRKEIAGPGSDKPPGIQLDNHCLVVRNVDPAESRIERCTPKEFCETFQLAPPEDVEKENPPVVASLVAGSQRPGELWTHLVWILLIVLMFELFVANRTHA